MEQVLFVAQFALLAFSLNFLWETWHAYYLYWGYRGKSFKEFSTPEYLKLISYVSSVDSAILTATLLGGYYIWGDIMWFTALTHAREAYYFILTVGIAVWIEIKGVYLMKEWSYLPVMPTVFGLGVSPLAQLAVTGLLAFVILG